MIYEQKRNIKLDNVKWMLTIMMVLYHIQVGNERIPLYIKNLGDSVVPAFTIISGFLFFRNVENIYAIKSKVYSRVKTLLLPYVLWNFANTILVNLIKSIQVGRVSSNVTTINIWHNIVLWESSPHFWYIFMLIFWTFFSPILYIVYKKRGLVIIILLIQLIYIFYKGDSILTSRFIYILYTWGGYLGYKKPDFFEKITDVSVRQKKIIITVGVFVFFGIYFVYEGKWNSMGTIVWLNAIRAVSFILFAINIPNLIVGERTQYRYSFWLFSVHFWLDCYISRFVKAHNTQMIVTQIEVWSIVLVIGIGSGIMFNQFFPKVFTILTGNRNKSEKIAGM